MPRKKKTADQAVNIVKTYDINSITAICKILGYSELTLMNFKLFEGLPMEFTEGNWRAQRKDILKWETERGNI